MTLITQMIPNLLKCVRIKEFNDLKTSQSTILKKYKDVHPNDLSLVQSAS